MNSKILLASVQKFIRNYTEDLSVLAFKGSPFEEVTLAELLQQIGGFRKTEKKLPTWHRTQGIIFPTKLSIEQTSSQLTAQYKASLVQGSTLADLTGGYGVDCFYFAKKFEKVHHFEIDQDLSEIAAHNFIKLQAKNVRCTSANGLTAIRDKKYDVIYVDPARRHESKGKVFFLTHCQPNIPEQLDYLLERCERLLIKTSPMLDIAVGLSELKQVVQIHVVAVNNEVKELLWLIDKKVEKGIEVTAVNLNFKDLQEFQFIYKKEEEASYGLPMKYLYEPNAAILKAGAFNRVSSALAIAKLHVNSHLYTSDQLIDFPGRRFVVERVIPYHKKEVKKAIAGLKANITTRNFKESVAQLRTKWKIKEGGDTYLFFTTNTDDQQVVLICSKIRS